MSNPACSMTTRAKNATQHPGYVQRQPCQPAAPNTALTKTQKAEAARVAKAKKAAVKKLNAARLSKFELDTMDREDVLSVTPCPNFTPVAGRFPSSDPHGADSILESEVDTNEMNPDKATYQPGSATEGDLLSDLSAIPTSPVKRTYAEIASPNYKSMAAVHAKATLGTTSAKSVAAATKPTEQAPAKLRAAQPEVLTDSQTRSHSLPSQSRRKPTKSTKTNPKPQATTALNRKADKALELDSATESTPTPTAQPQPLDLKTPAPLKKSKQTKVVSPHSTDTEPESLSCKPNPHSLQRLQSYLDLGEVDGALRKATVKPKLTLGRVDSSKDKAKNDGDEAAWRLWRARQSNVEREMDVDQPQVNAKGKGKETAQDQLMCDRTPIIPSDSEVEVDHSGKGKGKGKAKVKKVVPMLPPGGRSAASQEVLAKKQSHQNVDSHPK